MNISSSKKVVITEINAAVVQGSGLVRFPSEIPLGVVNGAIAEYLDSQDKVSSIVYCGVNKQQLEFAIYYK